MPRFHFRVTDAQGKPRTGTMEAPTQAAARELIEKRGFYVLDLKEVVGALPEIKVQPKGTQSRYHAGPAPRREYQPGLMERFTSKLPPAGVVRGGLAVLALVGLIWMVAGWQREQARVSAQRELPVVEPASYKIRLSGHVSLPEPSASPGDVELLVDLPEIPYQRTFEWAKLSHAQPGSFELMLEFRSQRKAQHLFLKARKPGYGESSAQNITLRPGGGEFKDLHLAISRPKSR